MMWAKNLFCPCNHPEIFCVLAPFYFPMPEPAEFPRTWTNSPLARIARMVLGNKANVAMVIGQTVHLSGTTREEFLADAEWLAHERVHIRQFREHGFVPFLWKYLVESARVGYFNNKYEVEARDEARRLTSGNK
jgi:hypothetical protein